MVLKDIIYIQRQTDTDRVRRLKFLRAYWIANVKDIDNCEKEVLEGFIYQARSEVDLAFGKRKIGS